MTSVPDWTTHIAYVDGPSGRRASLINGPDVWEVNACLIGTWQDQPTLTPEQLVEAVATDLSLAPELVIAARAYYASHRLEISEQIAENQQMAADMEKAWRDSQAQQND